MASTDAHDELISHLCTVTGVDGNKARSLLERNEWNLQEAVAAHYTEEEEEEEANPTLDRIENDFDAYYEQQQAAARETGQARSSQSATPSSGQSKPSQAPKKKFATLGDLSAGPVGGESDDDEENHDLFAGGEKSGLAVQNPDDIKKKIIEKAKKAAPTAGNDSQPPPPSRFSGTAHTLGGDDAPSEVVEDPNANKAKSSPRIKRTLHFWDDGFSVDDGNLYRSDDPENAHILNGIRQGRAPLSIMNVEMGQEVDVEIQQHEGKFVKPTPKYKPFGGQGQRLGSPTPAATQTAPAPTASTPAAASAGPSNSGLDESQPTVTLQIRLGDGTRLTSRFNTTQTIGDVYEFVRRAIPANETRQWVLMTTFPSTELKDRSAVLGEIKDFQRGGVVVQKWA